MNKRGEQAEARAARYLEAQGLKILERNYQCRHGEIDLIARDGATVVFVEVRARRSLAFGGAAASITAAKRGKLTRTALYYLATLGKNPRCRFDAVLLTGAGDHPGVQWLRDAFQADS
ncbi:MAG: YraN family protein [Betaproteobacteria bacterium]|nr:YraN family protein [Betaproteobacteria bacterium]